MQSFLAFEMFLFLLLAFFVAWAVCLSTSGVDYPSRGAKRLGTLESGREWCFRYLTSQLDRILIWSPCAAGVEAEPRAPAATVLLGELGCAQFGWSQVNRGLIRLAESARHRSWKTWLSDPDRSQHGMRAEVAAELIGWNS